MCGRFALFASGEEVAQRFELPKWWLNTLGSMVLYGIMVCVSQTIPL
jgi:hypothetical protein